MTDILDPNDLARFQSAQKEATAAQQRAEEAQMQAIAARGALDFESRSLATQYAIQQGDTLNIETGAITRAPRQESVIAAWEESQRERGIG